jgi:hypothetical protein
VSQRKGNFGGRGGTTQRAPKMVFYLYSVFRNITAEFIFLMAKGQIAFLLAVLKFVYFNNSSTDNNITVQIIT